MALHQDQQAAMHSGSRRLSQYLARTLLVVALLGGSLGFFTIHPQPVGATAGWNHFIDPNCPYSGRGEATPGINWWEWAPTSSGAASANLYWYDATSGYVRRDHANATTGFGSSGDVRHYVGSSSGSGWYKGEVVYDTTWAGSGSYAEERYCS